MAVNLATSSGSIVTCPLSLICCAVCLRHLSFSYAAAAVTPYIGAIDWKENRKAIMARIVMKFGGTSVGDVDRIRNVAAHVKREVDAGHQVAVVVSAMSGETNRLVGLTRDVAKLHDAREYDVVVSAGEQVSVGLLAMALQDIGVSARSWLGWQIAIETLMCMAQRGWKILTPPLWKRNLLKAGWR